MEDKIFLSRLSVKKTHNLWLHSAAVSFARPIYYVPRISNLIPRSFSYLLSKEIMTTMSQDLNILLHIQFQGNFDIYILKKTLIAISQMTVGYRGKRLLI